MLSLIATIALITCSTANTVTPSASRKPRISSTMDPISAARSPAITSSSSSSRGRAASARASSSRRASPMDSPAGLRAASPVRPSRSSTPSANSKAARLGAPRAPPYIAETATFSRTVMPRNGLTIWKVRATRACATRHGGAPVTSTPSTNTVPALGRKCPVIRLIRVDLPAPLGPITPRIVPDWTDSDTPDNACSAPKRRLRLRVSRMGVGMIARVSEGAVTAGRPGSHRAVPTARPTQPDPMGTAAPRE